MTEAGLQGVAFEEVEKAYNGVRAVAGVSFEARPGEILGLLGPNGAGKTTLIRMLLDILRPDAGRILVLGRPSWEAQKDRIGYLPEDRGLYRKQRVLEVMSYFGALKGMPAAAAREASMRALARAGLAERAASRIESLSKGMQQKVQILSTVLHDPDVVILDEPFSGLDPVNVQMVKEILGELRDAGKTVMLSSHQMAQVEILCDRIAMVHKGRLVLYGSLEEIRRPRAERALFVRGDGPWAAMGTVASAERAADGWRLVLRDNAKPGEFLAEALARNSPPESYEPAHPSLEEIFVRVVEEAGS